MFPVQDLKFGGMKYSGISRAVVLENADPDSKGRIRVSTPLFGESNWIPYLKQAGSFGVPEKGDVVFVTTDGGEHAHLVAFGNLTSGPDGATLPPSFKRSAPTNRGMYSKGGHLFELDDGTTLIKTGSGIRLTTAGGSKVHIVDDPTAPSITLERAEGQKIFIDGLTDKIDMQVKFGDKISISALDGIQMETPAAGGNTISLKAGMSNHKGTIAWSAEDGSGAKLNLANGLVALGNGAGELFDLLIQQQDILIAMAQSMATETHTGNLGYPTSPPTNAADYVKAATDLGTKIKAKFALMKGSL